MIELINTNLLKELRELFFDCFFNFEQANNCNIVYISSNSKMPNQKGFGDSIYDFGLGCRINIEYLDGNKTKRLCTNSTPKEWCNFGIYEHCLKYDIQPQYLISHEPTDVGLFYYSKINYNECKQILFDIKRAFTSETDIVFNHKNLKLDENKEHVTYQF